ncbi:MAG: amidase [Bradymonadaceae bacterium]|nr:amidase [Lujinxingiaceae bacterium]
MKPGPLNLAALLATPRLSGAALTLVRRVAQTRAGQALLLGRTFSSYGIDRLLALEAEARCDLQFDARPLTGAPPRGWHDAELGAPGLDPARQSAAELRAGYLAADFTPLEVFDALARRIDSADFGQAVFSPFVALDMRRGREAARESSERYLNQRSLGPLDGVPVPVKDQHHLEGLPTRCGTAYRNERAAADGYLVRMLRAGGALVYAKTHSTEWGMNPAGFNPHFDMPRNVFHRDRGAGGSSTGAAVAVGLGLSPLASGSDGGGSVRIPAAMNGIFGIKPSFVRIGRSGDDFGSGTVSTVGPLGQSTTDLVDFLQVAASGRDPHDPTSWWAPEDADLVSKWRAALGRGVRGCRIGIIESEWRDAPAALALSAHAALKELEREGAVLVDVSLPLAAHAPALGVVTIGTETMGNLTDDFELYGESMSEELRLILHLLATISARDFLKAQRTREQLRRQVRAVFGQLDLLAMPTTAAQAAVYEVSDNRVHIADEQATRDMCRFTFLANLTGLPAGSVPVGLQAGMPVGLQFIGDAWDEASVLAAMAHCERLEISKHASPPDYRRLI